MWPWCVGYLGCSIGGGGGGGACDRGLLGRCSSVASLKGFGIVRAIFWATDSLVSSGLLERDLGWVVVKTAVS